MNIILILFLFARCTCFLKKREPDQNKGKAWAAIGRDHKDETTALAAARAFDTNAKATGA